MPYNTQPLVSVCIGTYNRERYIRECLDSVLDQTYRNIEIIVVDDASTDRTVPILRTYKDLVRLVERKRNSGLAGVVRNEAIRHASGRYLAFLDSDDSWYPSKIQQQVEFLESTHEIPFCHTYCHLMDESSTILGIRHERALPPTGLIFDQLLKHCWICTSTVMLCRSLIDEIGFFTEDARYKIGEDLEFYLRVSSRYPIGLVAPDKVLAKYRRHTCNISGTDWKHKPTSVLVLRMLLAREDIWGGVVDRHRMVQAVVETALQNAEYWGELRHVRRAAWSAFQAVQVNPTYGPAWRSLFIDTLKGFRKPFRGISP